jgi:hypothetical protein
MGDLIQFPGTHPVVQESTQYQCPNCGGEWWIAVVVFSKERDNVTGWAVSGDDAEPQCMECGDTW